MTNDVEFAHYKELIMSKIGTLETDFKEFKKDMDIRYEKIKDTMSSNHSELKELFIEFKNKIIGIVIAINGVVAIAVPLLGVFWKG